MPGQWDTHTHTHAHTPIAISVSLKYTVLMNAGVMEDALLYVQTAIEVALQRIAETVAKVCVGLQSVDSGVAV